MLIENTLFDVFMYYCLNGSAGDVGIVIIYAGDEMTIWMYTITDTVLVMFRHHTYILGIIIHRVYYIAIV